MARAWVEGELPSARGYSFEEITDLLGLDQDATRHKLLWDHARSVRRSATWCATLIDTGDRAGHPDQRLRHVHFSCADLVVCPQPIFNLAATTAEMHPVQVDVGRRATGSLRPCWLQSEHRYLGPSSPPPYAYAALQQPNCRCIPAQMSVPEWDTVA